MISQETKDQIEKDIQSIPVIASNLQHIATTNTINGNLLTDFRQVLTKYAEKLEEKDKIIESKDCELAQLRKDYEFLEEDNRDMEGRLRVYPPSEAEKEAAEWHRKYLELTQLKEIAEKIIKILHNANQEVGQIGADIHDRATARLQAGVDQALTAYAEWCKQNLK